MVLVVSGERYPLCYDCHKDELHQPVKNLKMKKLFSIPEEFYQRSLFLRSVKINYLKFGRLTDRQVEFFKKTVDEFSAVK